jgi:hypothetical protein
LGALAAPQLRSAEPLPTGNPTARASVLHAGAAPHNISSASPAVEAGGTPLPRFDLDFPGGRPEQLVKAIETASGKPINMIIPPDDANIDLPALKLRNVTAPELFDALGSASARQVTRIVGYNYGPGGKLVPATGVFTTRYRFSTPGPLKADSIWYLAVEGNAPSPAPPPAPEEPRACQFFQLAPYLEAYKVEDITTAIETGWKLLSDSKPPEMKFHKDTTLLIAVGPPEALRMIDEVLTRLGSQIGARAAAPNKGKGEPARP